MTTQEKKQPATVIKLGRIKATVWKNESSVGDRYNTKLTKIYRVEESKREQDDTGWRETDFLSRDELLLASKVLDLTHTWIYEQTE